MPVGFLRHEHAGSVQTGDRRRAGSGPQSGQQHIRSDLLRQSGGDGGVQPDFDIPTGDLPALELQICLDLLLEGHLFLAEERAAQPVRLLAENDPVSPVGAGDGCLHAPDAAPGNEHGF